MKIFIELTLSQEIIENAIKENGITLEEIKENFEEGLSEEMGETISDNWKFFSQTKFKVEI